MTLFLNTSRVRWLNNKKCNRYCGTTSPLGACWKMCVTEYSNLIMYRSLVVWVLRCQRRSSDKDVYWWSLVTLIANSGGACVTAMSLRVESSANDKDPAVDMRRRRRPARFDLDYWLVRRPIKIFVGKIIISISLFSKCAWSDSKHKTHTWLAMYYRPHVCAQERAERSQSTVHYSYCSIFEKF